jgi:hypothetical protein
MSDIEFEAEQGRRRAATIEAARPPPSEDLLWGAAAIAEFLGWTVDRVYYQVRKNADKKTPENEKLPIAKLGPKTMVASRKKLQRALAEKLATQATQ